MDICEINEKTEHFEQPYNNNDHNNDVQYLFDLAIHRDVGVDQPEKNSNHDQSDD